MRPESVRLHAVAFLDLFDLIASHHDALYPNQAWVDPETTIERMVLEIEHWRGSPALIAGSAGQVIRKHSEHVLWPFTEVSHIRVGRGFAAWMIWQTRKQRGRGAASRVWSLYRSMNGRPLPDKLRAAKGRKVAS